MFFNLNLSCVFTSRTNLPVVLFVLCRGWCFPSVVCVKYVDIYSCTRSLIAAKWSVSIADSTLLHFILLVKPLPNVYVIGMHVLHPLFFLRGEHCCCCCCVFERTDCDLSLIMVLFLMLVSQTALKIIAMESGSQLLRHHHSVPATIAPFRGHVG
jgi:hypothetical protein